MYGHEEEIEGVDLGCRWRRVGVWVGMKYIKPNCYIVAGLF